MRAVPVFVAVLLVLSSPALAAVASGPAATAGADELAVQETATPARLALEAPVRSSAVAPTPDLTATLAAEDETIRTDYETFALDRRADELSSAERANRIDAGLERIDARLADLETRERRAVARHADGEIGDRELLRVLVRNNREATELIRTVESLDEHAEAVPGYSIDTGAMTGPLETYQSPVRERVEDAFRDGSAEAAGSERSSALVSLETSEQGVVLSTVEGGQYLREAIRFDNRDRSLDDRFETPSDPFVHAEENIYPWAIEERDHVSISFFESVQLYRLDVYHPQGNLITYIDGGTGDVYKELHQLDLDDLPREGAGTWTGDGLAVSIDRTPSGGPVAVNVTDADTGERVDAAVEVDGVAVGETTTAGGELWAIPPRGEYDVTVRDGDRRVNATVRP